LTAAIIRHDLSFRCNALIFLSHRVKFSLKITTTEESHRIYFASWMLGVAMPHTILDHANLTSALMNGIGLQDATLVEALLSGANLEGANLQGPILAGPR
jgi:uncharacterized protein YjbI with pentapeptide repeats